MMRELPPDFAYDADLAVLGASAGGIEALMALLQELQPPLRMAIAIVLHLAEHHESRLAEVFGRRLRLPVQEAQAHAPIAPGHVYFAPPGYHLLVEPDLSFSLSCEPPVWFSRPSIDLLFESAADACPGRLLGMVLTGASEDGARGLAAIKAAGGLTAVQDPAESCHSTMPAAAIRVAAPAFVLPMAGLRALLHTVVRQ